MNNLNQIQPIDGYVKMLLESVKEKYHLNIDLEHPTRGQRLEAALAMKNEDSGVSSIEIMIGRRLSSDDPKDQSYHFMLLSQGMFPMDIRTFYEGFSHSYYPEEKKSSSPMNKKKKI